MKAFILAAASLALVATPLAASAQSYGHGHDGGGWSRSAPRGDGGHGYGRYGRGDDGGGAVLAGVAGLLLGSALVESQSYDRPYGYAQPYAYSTRYVQECDGRSEAYEDRYGNVEYRPERFCR